MVLTMLKTPEKPSSAPTENAPISSSSDTKVRELTETLQRVQADFENYRKRSQLEMNVNYLRGKATAFKDMLSFMDTLDSAITKEKDQTKKTLENVRTHLLHVLAQNGVKPISTVGKIFDPFTSECLMQGNDAQRDEDIVLEEMLRGYYFHDDVLRPAKVKVNKPTIHSSVNNVSVKNNNTNHPYQSTTNNGGNKHE